MVSGIFSSTRDALHSPRFKSIVRESGVTIMLTAYQAPNMNAYAERFVRSIKSECLDRMIFLGQESLESSIHQYVAHYHAERPHQGRENVVLRGRGCRRVGLGRAFQRIAPSLACSFVYGASEGSE